MRPPSAPVRRSHRYRLQLETLEAREVPAGAALMGSAGSAVGLTFHDGGNRPPGPADGHIAGDFDRLHFRTPQDQSLERLITAVDPEGDPVTFTLPDTPRNGVAKMTADGVFRYTPNPGFVGHDKVLFHVSDGKALRNWQSITITVVAPGDADADGVSDAEEAVAGFDRTIDNPRSAGVLSVGNGAPVRADVSGILFSDVRALPAPAEPGLPDGIRLPLGFISLTVDTYGYLTFGHYFATITVPDGWHFDSFWVFEGTWGDPTPRWRNLAAAPLFVLEGMPDRVTFLNDLDDDPDTDKIIVPISSMRAGGPGFREPPNRPPGPPTGQTSTDLERLHFRTPQDQVMERSLTSVDPDGDAVTFGLYQGLPSAHGAIDLTADGVLRYTPRPGFVGHAFFSFVMSDGIERTFHSATITVVAPGDADADGVSDAEEAAAGFGGAIHDPQSAGLRSALDGAPVHFGGSDLFLREVRAVAEPDTSGRPADLSFPLGFFSFQATIQPPTASAPDFLYHLDSVYRWSSGTVSIAVPDGSQFDSYWQFAPSRFNPTPHWQQITQGIRFVNDADDDPDTDTIIFNISDVSFDPGGLVQGAPGGPAFRMQPPAIDQVLVNDGARQRSLVTRLTVRFRDRVTIAEGAFEVRQRGTHKTFIPHVALSTIRGKTVAVLTFAGPGIEGGSLPDGRYTLMIHGKHIRNVLGQALEGDGTSRDEARVEFFRRFGDHNGDDAVDRRDLKHFLRSLGSRAGQRAYRAHFDFNGDGRIEMAELFVALGKQRGLGLRKIV
jgi:hypothetical protein